jgi:3'-5' exoribonuclease
MMKGAAQLCEVYRELNRDLLLCGVLFHDAGKLWENHIPETGFVMPFDERAELLGHIVIGIEFTNALWRRALQENAEAWQHLRPASEDVRLHLLHLVAAHHGELEYGSPVVPKTPEAVTLHYLDNLDAKLEMFATGYKSGTNIAPKIVERVKPLPGNLVEQLEKFQPEP